MTNTEHQDSIVPSPELLIAIESVTAKRPRTVLDHILKNGFITTAELRDTYGYNHPPRAARDVREAGIQLETTRVTGPDGRKIGAYRFVQAPADDSRASGRRAFPKAFKDELLGRYGEACGLCGAHVPARALQIDHRIPYEIAGEEPSFDPARFMLVDGSCNRAKSWTCEHCPNWTAHRSDVCLECGWASPERYSHVATEAERRLTLVWQGSATSEFDELRGAAEEASLPVDQYVKGLLRPDSRRAPGTRRATRL